MKIAVFTDSYRPYVSGVVRSIETFTSELVAMGHQVYVFAPRYYPDSRRGGPQIQEEETAVSGVRVFRYWSLPVPTYAGFVLPLPFSPYLDALLSRLKVDIIHTHSPFLMGCLGVVAARKCRLPLVFTHHSMYHEYVHYVPGAQALARMGVLRYLAAYCRRCDLVIAPTPQIREFIRDTYRVRRPVASIPTGIALEPYARADKTWLRRSFGIEPDAPVLLFVGRLGREKNVELLLKAFRIVAAAHPRARLVLVGDGPDRWRLEREAARLHVGEQLVFTGTLPKERVTDCYVGADLFFFASTTETQGLVTLEAMAGGLPVVAVDAPGTHDMVTDGVEGYLTPLDAGSLAQAASALLTDAGLRADMGARAGARATVLSSRNMALRLVEAYRSLLSPVQKAGEGRPRRLLEWGRGYG